MKYRDHVRTVKDCWDMLDAAVTRLEHEVSQLEVAQQTTGFVHPHFTTRQAMTVIGRRLKAIADHEQDRLARRWGRKGRSSAATQTGASPCTSEPSRLRVVSSR